jgi:hypothetical protein
MAKRVHPFSLSPLDGEIEAFLRRLGEPGRDRPLNYVTGYGVHRAMDAPHRLVIEFVADDEFDAAPEAESPPPGG